MDEHQIYVLEVQYSISHLKNGVRSIYSYKDKENNSDRLLWITENSLMYVLTMLYYFKHYEMCMYCLHRLLIENGERNIYCSFTGHTMISISLLSTGSICLKCTLWNWLVIEIRNNMFRIENGAYNILCSFTDHRK